MPTKGWPRGSVLGGWGGAARGGSAGVALAVGQGLAADRRGLGSVAESGGRRPRAMNEAPRSDCRRAEFDHFEATLTIATMPAFRASGNSGQSATTAARPGSVLQVSAGKRWATLGVGCRKSFVNRPLGEPACGLINLYRAGLSDWPP